MSMLSPNSSSPQLLRPIQSDDFLPPISRLLSLSGLFLISTIGIVITLSAISKYKVSVKAPATIRPIENIYPIENIHLASHATPLLVKAYITVQDINQVQIGQPAQMRISACPYPDYGTLQGTVTAISSDVRGVQPASYEVTIQPLTRFLGQAMSPSHQCMLRAGMEGSVDIVSTEETVLQLILRKARLVTNL